MTSAGFLMVWAAARPGQPISKHVSKQAWRRIVSPPRADGVGRDRNGSIASRRVTTRKTWFRYEMDYIRIKVQFPLVSEVPHAMCLCNGRVFAAPFVRRCA